MTAVTVLGRETVEWRKDLAQANSSHRGLTRDKWWTDSSTLHRNISMTTLFLPLHGFFGIIVVPKTTVFL